MLRPSPSGWNVGQPEHALADQVVGHEAQRRPGAGEEWLAATKHDGVEVESILVDEAKMVFGLNQSLDGYIDHQAFDPDPALFRHFIEQMRDLTGSVYGRRMYEVMRYWDEDDPGWNVEERDFATAWRRQPKWVVSRSLTSVGPNATLVEGDIAPVIRGLKDRLEGEIEVAGPALAGSLTDLGLIDEYRLYLHPVVVGGGKPFFAGPRPPLRLVANELVGEGVIRLTYVPA